MNIDFANLDRQYQKYKKEIDGNIQKVLNASNYIMGDEIFQLESSLQQFCNVKHAITCSSGTDALSLVLMAYDIGFGDEVITTPFSFVATAEAIALRGATPVFVDIDLDTFNLDSNLIEAAITKNTKAILTVGLFGQPSDVTLMHEIAKKFDLKLIIDGAQSFGASLNGVSESALGDIATTSFFPAKPLGCYGDGGALFTSDDLLADKLKKLRLHGSKERYRHEFIGTGARLDTIQAAILQAKLKYYSHEIKARNKIACGYAERLFEKIKLPVVKSDRVSVWAQYTIRDPNREQLKNRLAAKGVPTSVHYPCPLHLQECFRYLGYKRGDFQNSEKAANEVLSLPMNAFITEDELDHISSLVNSCSSN